jgi:predicted nucleic acid-binding protein
VIDATIGLAWLFADDDHHDAVPLIDRVAISCAYVPAHWWLEVTNATFMAGRCFRSRREPHELLATLRYLPIYVDRHTSDRAISSTLAIAVKYRISVHDAAYVELAKRLRLPFASLEYSIAMAAHAEGIALAIEPLEPYFKPFDWNLAGPLRR